jgi:hypothetical protein
MAVTCARCNSDRIACIFAKCNHCTVNIVDKEHKGLVPENLGIGGRTLIEFSFCMGCGQIMGKFPIPTSDMEEDKITLSEPLDKGVIENLLKGLS